MEAVGQKREATEPGHVGYMELKTGPCLLVKGFWLVWLGLCRNVHHVCTMYQQLKYWELEGFSLYVHNCPDSPLMAGSVHHLALDDRVEVVHRTTNSKQGVKNTVMIKSKLSTSRIISI